MFVYDAHPGFYGDDTLTTDRPGKRVITQPSFGLGESSDDPNATILFTTTTTPTTTTTGETKVNPRVPALTFPVPGKSRRKGAHEVHATWSFNQDSCNFASKLYIQYVRVYLKHAFAVVAAYLVARRIALLVVY